jgi:uncharacterized protein YegP (UPF0339 family)
MAKETVVELWKGKNKKWFFHKKYRNGETSSTSQGYKQKRYAKVAIERDLPGFPVVELDPK